MSKWLGLCLLVCGCFSTDLDPNVEGAFSCSVDDDCPDSQACDGQRCVAPENVPVMRILSPEPAPPEVFRVEAFPNDEIEVRISGTLAFAESPEDDSPGSGFVELTVDGMTQRIDQGPLSGGIPVTVDFDPTPGPHRISAQAVRADGEPYAGPQSNATALFWIDNDEPAVAITRPWPGTAFDLGTPMIEVEVATLNFDMQEASMMPEAGIGHAHVYYDRMFPGCADTSDCDRGYLTIVNPPGGTTAKLASAPITLPESAATMATLTAVLRNDDHTPYRFPFGDPQGKLIFDDVSILRVAE
jgi:hypothetical protein